MRKQRNDKQSDMEGKKTSEWLTDDGWVVCMDVGMFDIPLMHYKLKKDGKIYAFHLKKFTSCKIEIKKPNSIRELRERYKTVLVGFSVENMS